MRFGKKYSNMTVLMAMLHGVVIGIVAIFVVGLFLVGAEGKRPIDQIEKEIPASGPENGKDEGKVADKSPETLTFYAKQHGAFTTSTAAATFIEENPSLSTAAVIEVDGGYFVWSAVGQTEAEIEAILVEDTYKKTFSVTPNACETAETAQIWQFLNLNEYEKIKNSDVKAEGKEGQKLAKKIDTITTFTNDVKVIRLHLLAGYAAESGCVKISF